MADVARGQLKELIDAGVDHTGPRRRAGPNGRRIPLEALSIVGVFVIWFVATHTIVKPLIFPSPESVLDAFYRRSEVIAEYVVATLFRVLLGFCIGSAFGIVNGITLQKSVIMGRLSDPVIEILRPIPPIAMIPFFIIWFGIGDLGKVVLVAAGCSMILLVNTVEAIQHVNPTFIQAALTLGADKNYIYRTVIIPAILPSVFAGLRVALALSFTLAIAAEFMGAQSGLGFMIMQARRFLDTPAIIAGIILVGLLNLGLDRILRYVGSRVLRWSPRMGEWE